MRDTEKRKVSMSMDDLMVRTVGMMETFPRRIEKIEEYVREISLQFSNHEGEQSQGIKRITDRIDNIDKIQKELHDQTCKQVDSLQDDVNKLASMEGLTAEQKTLIEEMKGVLDTLSKDYDSRQSVKKTMWYYFTSVFGYFLRYAMLPITIAILLFMGISPDIIPGYKPSNTTMLNTSIENQFNNASVSLIMLANNNSINESDVRHWVNQRAVGMIVVSEETNLNNAIRQNGPVKPRHFFVWLPKNSKSGYIQIYGLGGRKIGSPLNIERGK